MPDYAGILADGLNYEKGAAFAHALDCYETVARSAAPPGLVAEAWCRASSVHRVQCDWERALAAARQSAAVADEAELSDQYAEALNAEAVVHQLRGEFDVAVPLFEQILSTTSDFRVRGMALQNLGAIAAQRGGHEQAESYFNESSQCFKAAGYAWGEAIALNNYAALLLDQKRYQLARDIGAIAVEAARRVEDSELLGITMLNCAEASAGEGNVSEAEDLASTALGYFKTARNPLRQIECLRLLGDINVSQNSVGPATRCFAEGLRLAEELGAVHEIEKLRARVARLQRDDARSDPT
ncbi:MAG: tetratricopeptide repeat protein [Gemmatimonadota bacterium]|nr:tetratricopeptide repeat protein [Gemmatimonadota bacterium]